MQRRRFLLGAISGLTVAANADSFFGRALAQPTLPGLPGNSSDRVLVVVNLQGGNDGLNTVVPYGMPDYYRYRPTLAVPQGDVLRIDDQFGLNPGMRSFKALYDKGQVAIVHGAGYPKPDHSHFRSTQIWQTAAPDAYLRTGWLGRYLDAERLPATDLFGGVAIAQVLPEAMLADRTDVPAISQLAGYGLTSDRNEMTRGAFRSIVADTRVPFSSPYLGTVTEIEEHAQSGSEELPRLIAGYKTGASYPATPLGRSLALAAQIVGSRLGTRVIYLQHGSFDTHVSQQAQQDRLLTQFSDGIAAFYDDLAQHGNDGRVLTMTFSEFGRRVAENASRGTDHGEAAPLFLIGGAIKGGLYGRHPSFDEMDEGDITFTTDFRSVYTTIVEKWLGRSAAGVIAGTFPAMTMLG